MALASASSCGPSEGVYSRGGPGTHELAWIRGYRAARQLGSWSSGGKDVWGLWQPQARKSQSAGGPSQHLASCRRVHAEALMRCVGKLALPSAQRQVLRVATAASVTESAPAEVPPSARPQV